MKIFPLVRELFLFPFGLLFALTPSLRGDVIYDNGAPRYLPKTDGFEMTHWVNADDFTLNTAARLESIQFGTIESGGVFQGSIAWSIYSNSPNNTPGSLIYWGTANPVTHLPTGYVEGPEVEYVSVFAIQPVTLQPGTYWLALHNGPLSFSTNQRVYWELAATNGARPSQSDAGPQFSGDWDSNAFPVGTPAEVVFRLNGVSAARVTDVAFASGKPIVSFTTSLGRSYRLEYRDNFTDSWATVPGAALVPGTGNSAHIPDLDPNIANIRRRFYRVLVL